MICGSVLLSTNASKTTKLVKKGQYKTFQRIRHIREFSDPNFPFCEILRMGTVSRLSILAYSDTTCVIAPDRKSQPRIRIRQNAFQSPITISFLFREIKKFQ